MADSGRSRFSIRNISFRKPKDKNRNRPRSSIEVTHFDSESTLERSSTQKRTGTSKYAKSTVSLDTTKNRHSMTLTSTYHKKSSRVDFTANDAWNKPLVGQAVQPFTAILRCDLTFEAGDKIQILTRTSKQFDWWEGTVRGRTGIFPANYIKLLE